MSALTRNGRRGMAVPEWFCVLGGLGVVLFYTVSILGSATAESLKKTGGDGTDVRTLVGKYGGSASQPASSGSGSSSDSSNGSGDSSGSSSSGSSKPKGNNGVGNGEDGQPPGNPPVNDGEGTSPGNPGNKGGV